MLGTHLNYMVARARLVPLCEIPDWNIGSRFINPKEMPRGVRYGYETDLKMAVLMTSERLQLQADYLPSGIRQEWEFKPEQACIYDNLFFGFVSTAVRSYFKDIADYRLVYKVALDFVKQHGR